MVTKSKDDNNMNICPECGSDETLEKEELDVIMYGGEPLGEPEAQIPVKVPVGICTVCDFKWTDYRAEEIHENAVKQYLQQKGFKG